MNYASSRMIRKIIGRLNKGESLTQSLMRLCKRERIRAGSIQAVGVLKHITLQTYNEQSGYQTVLEENAHFELISLSGNISMLGDQTILNCYAQLSTKILGQWHTLGGRLDDAEALNVEFVIEVFEDLVLERRLDARTSLPLLSRIERSGEPVNETIDTRVQTTKAPPAEPSTKTSNPPKQTSTPSSPESRPKAFTSDGTVVTQASSPKIVRRPSAPKPSEETKVEIKKPRKPEPKPEPKPIHSPKSEPKPAPKPAPKPEPKPKSSSWADAVKVSQTTTNPPSKQRTEQQAERLAMVNDWPDIPEMRVGDFLIHPHFGRCRIIFVEEDDFVRVKTRTGKVLDIKLEIFEITPEGEESGHQIFTCERID